MHNLYSLRNPSQVRFKNVSFSWLATTWNNFLLAFRWCQITWTWLYVGSPAIGITTGSRVGTETHIKNTQYQVYLFIYHAKLYLRRILFASCRSIFCLLISTIFFSRTSITSAISASRCTTTTKKIKWFFVLNWPTTHQVLSHTRFGSRLVTASNLHQTFSRKFYQGMTLTYQT